MVHVLSIAFLTSHYGFMKSIEDLVCGGRESKITSYLIFIKKEMTCVEKGGLVSEIWKTTLPFLPYVLLFRGS